MNHDSFMGAAMEVARRAQLEGNMAVGAVVVRGGEIVSEGPNSARSEMDPTAHAEVTAIRRAARKLQTLDLTGCTLYSTVEPCPMCCWSILVSGIGCLVLGSRHVDIGRPEMGKYSVEALLQMTGRPLQLVTGIRRDECTEAFRSWLRANASPGPSTWFAASASE